MPACCWDALGDGSAMGGSNDEMGNTTVVVVVVVVTVVMGLQLIPTPDSRRCWSRHAGLRKLKGLLCVCDEMNQRPDGSVEVGVREGLHLDCSLFLQVSLGRTKKYRNRGVADADR